MDKQTGADVGQTKRQTKRLRDSHNNVTDSSNYRNYTRSEQTDKQITKLILQVLVPFPLSTLETHFLERRQ